MLSYDISRIEPASSDVLDAIAKLESVATVSDGVASFPGVLSLDAAWIRDPGIGSVRVTWDGALGPEGRGVVRPCRAGPLIGERTVRGTTRAPTPDEALRVWLCGAYVAVGEDGAFAGWAPEGRPCLAWVERTSDVDPAQGPVAEVPVGASTLALIGP